MKKQLVKLLESGEDVLEQFTPETIHTYLQAKQTVDSLQHLVIVPYVTFAKQKNESVVYEELDANKNVNVKITLHTTVSDKHRSNKVVVDEFEDTLESILVNSSLKNRMFGVRKFGETLAVDISYLQKVYDNLITEVTGTSTSQRITVKGDKLPDIEKLYRGNLIFADQTNIYLENELTDKSATYLYLAAIKQKKLLEKKLIVPFEELFKDDVTKSATESVFTDTRYENMFVQVKTTPRNEPDYKKVNETMQNYLSSLYLLQPYQADNKITFYNVNLNTPRMYVSVENIYKKLLELKKATTKTKYQQEVHVLYAPEAAFLLTEE